MAKRPMWEPVFHAGATHTDETEPIPRNPRSAPARANGRPEFVPYVRHARDDEGAALDAAARLATIRAQLPPEWHAWHAALPPVGTSKMGAAELAWIMFWREAV